MENIKYFTVSQYNENNENNVKDICFGANESVAKFPDDVINLKDEFELFSKLINRLLADNEILYNYYYERLYSLADLAFNSKINQIQLAHRGLDKIKDELIYEIGPSLRSKLLFDFINICYIPFILMGLFTIGFIQYPPLHNLFFISSLLLIIMGSQIGCWLSLASRTKGIEFKEILPTISDPKGLKARILFVSIFSLAMAVLMKCGLITISIGSFSSTTIETSPYAALAIGIIMGFSEKVFVDKFEEKIKTVKI
ncbi:hypothetical protein GRJ22_08965 [Photobacterium carnosum]|uniref:hypothetical protein n=1 Tax=Photobacterium carnosum TaxID=2023717 RepID=UPI001E2B8D33|nr:hypothetical protein [Photobacterium carnosum]MCD9556568.1 hypothetical protein [Photobacterium carnosum]